MAAPGAGRGDERVRVRVFEDYENLGAIGEETGLVDSPRWAPLFRETLGSMFIAHPPIGPYTGSVAEPDHPLVTGVEPFEVTDELYLMESYGPLQVLLETRFAGEAPGFAESQWKEATHPVFYIKSHGAGAVLHLTLGHCRGHYDLQPLMEYWPTMDRCAWELPVFRELLRRGGEGRGLLICQRTFRGRSQSRRSAGSRLRSSMS